ncbi:MAG: response regulator [Ginsengibacter sp.]
MARVKKIMIADDDSSIIDVLTLMLETSGYKVHSAANRQIIEDVNEFCPDLILLDILMLGVSGQNICEQLKKQESTKHIPVIIISASKDAKEIALQAEADDFIAKPFEMEKLLKKVAKYTKK